MSHALTDAQMLTIWERGLVLGPTERALLTLAVAEPSLDAAELRRWPIGRRDARLFELRAATFGPAMRCCVTCPRCQGDSEFDVDVRELCARAGGDGEIVNHDFDACRVHARLPTSEDLCAIEHIADPNRAEALLWERCVEIRDGTGQRIAAEAIDAQLRVRIETLLDERDPLLDPRFQVACAECGLNWVAPCDAPHVLWLDFALSARELLAQVDALARAYGWTEDQILALSRGRRQLYLAMVQA
ncbi:MAG TPA: hypothetical protein VGO61_03640 [Steroidobacteraceae bacterium]|jgi:hypothetical protein|nr:hypothetical protein [Steroidobacteraceae bacterium]